MPRNMLSATVAIALSTALAGCQIDSTTPATDGVGAPSLEVSATQQSSQGAAATLNAQLAEVRRLTAPYHNIDKARAAGYVLTANEPCISHPTLGAMGYHAVNTTLRNDGAINLLEPDVLVYEKKPNGGYQLNAVEYFELKSTWDAAHGGAGAAPPTLFGANVPLSNHPPFGLHYELHVWLFQHNPSGMFASWNPTVSCP
ncbi:MAG: hypothetical protein ABIS03_13680 [Gemmatimonadaceae bacterium]